MILASIKPYYYYLIAEEKKKIEVRKTAFKNLPQDIAFYMSKDEKSFAKIPKEYQEKYRKHFGKVGMRVVCDRIEMVNAKCSDYGIDLFYHDCLTKGCLTEREIEEYFNIPENKDLRVMKGNGYAWHISDLKIYDKPKELREFRKPLDSVYCSYYRDYCEEGCVGFGSTDYVCNDYWNWEKGLTRPPQSYMFVEEVEQ